MRKLLSAIALTGILVVSLAACSSTGTNSSSNGCTPTASGANSDKVKVTGKFGAEPKVTFSKGLTTKSTERSVVTAGSGKTVAAANSNVTLNYAVYNGTTGKKIDATGYTKGKDIPYAVNKDSIVGLYKAVLCSTAGTRVATIIPPADAFGTAGNSSLGIGAKDSVIFVIDVDSVKAPVKALAKANGTPQAAPAGFPTVVLAASGAPTITMPTTAPPTATQVAVLKKGSGKVVKAGDSVTMNYTGAIYATGKVFDSSWTRGQTFTTVTSGVIPGFTKALVGQAVGSQVIVVIPPVDGYGASGTSDGSIKGTDTIVFVIDILATS